MDSEWLKLIETENIDKLNTYDLTYFMFIVGYSHAAKMGCLNVLKWFYAKAHKKYNCDDLFKNIIKYGHLDVLKWIVSNQLSVDELSWSKYAAAFGHLHILEWIHANKLAWNSEAYGRALYNGHIHIVNWIRSHYNYLDGGSITNTDLSDFTYNRLKIILAHCDEAEWIKAIDKELELNLGCSVLEQLIKNYL